MNRPAEEVAHFVLERLRLRHGRRWLGGRQAGHAKPSACEHDQLLQNPLRLLRIYQLKSVGRDAHQGLVGWLEGRYPLELRHDIPSPRQMLDEQCVGRRPVSWLEDPPPEAPHPFGRHPDALAFLLHDLEHGHKFFANPEMTHGQIVFFNRLRQALPRFEIFEGDAELEGGLHYMMGDMNSHPLHLTKYMKAIALNAFERAGRRSDYTAWCTELCDLWGMPRGLSAAFLRINDPDHETETDRQTVSRFFLTASF